MDFDLGKLADEALTEKLATTVREERCLTIEVLHPLREVEARELFASWAFQVPLLIALNI